MSAKAVRLLTCPPKILVLDGQNVFTVVCRRLDAVTLLFNPPQIRLLNVTVERPVPRVWEYGWLTRLRYGLVQILRWVAGNEDRIAGAVVTRRHAILAGAFRHTDAPIG